MRLFLLRSEYVLSWFHEPIGIFKGVEVGMMWMYLCMCFCVFVYNVIHLATGLSSEAPGVSDEWLTPSSPLSVGSDGPSNFLLRSSLGARFIQIATF